MITWLWSLKSSSLRNTFHHWSVQSIDWLIDWFIYLRIDQLIAWLLAWLVRILLFRPRRRKCRLKPRSQRSRRKLRWKRRRMRMISSLIQRMFRVRAFLHIIFRVVFSSLATLYWQLTSLWSTLHEMVLFRWKKEHGLSVSSHLSTRIRGGAVVWVVGEVGILRSGIHWETASGSERFVNMFFFSSSRTENHFRFVVFLEFLSILLEMCCY